MQQYLNLNISAKGRLNYLRREAEKHNAKHYTSGGATWRDMRLSGFHNARTNAAALSRGFNGGEPVWYSHAGEEFPREQWADDVINLRHTGWYTDTDGHSTVRGIVVSLPRGRFLAGYYWSDNGERVYYADIYDDAESAARRADSEAERFAENNERFQAAQELEIEETDGLARLRELVSLRNNPCFAYARDEARELIERIREIRETLKTEYADVL